MNHNNYYFLNHLTAQLQTILQGALFVEGFSTSKQEIWLVFKTETGSYFPIKLNFIATDSVLSFPTDVALPKNKQPQFRLFEAKAVEAVTVHSYERSFHIQFAGGLFLYIKLFGKNGNIISINNNTVVDVFRKQISADARVDFSQVIIPKNIDVEALLSTTNSAADVAKNLPFLPADAQQELVNQRYFEADTNRKLQIAETVLAQLTTSHFYISKSADNYSLSFYNQEEVLGEYTDAVSAQNDFARLYLGKYFFEEKKSQLTHTLKQRKEKLEKEIHSKKTKLQTIATQTPYSHIGDILMAHLHQLQKGLEKTTLLNFYTNENIDIRLKKELSPQENAENYYRKAKNQQKEIEVLQDNLQKAETELADVAQKLESALQAADGKSLRGMEKDKQAVENIDKPTLFKEFEKSGYAILVGKNSVNNDLLTQKHAAKNDVWLHARGLAGSHVVIKTKPGQTVPVDVLEYAAALAAYFSKGRTDSLCPVIYTEKKYVRKPKGAAAGQVVVEKEKTLLVKPAFQ